MVRFQKVTFSYTFNDNLICSLTITIFKTEEPIKKRDKMVQEECTVVSSMKPLYICMNAIQRHHKCTYALCYSCKTAEDDEVRARQDTMNGNRRSSRFDNSAEGYDKRLRDKMNNKYDNDNRLDTDALKYSCRHYERKTLIPFMESDYFTTTYQEKVKSDNSNFPVRCGECRKKLKGVS